MSRPRRLAEALEREAAQVIERAVSGMRTTAHLRERWWRPSWEAGYQAGLRDVHEEIQHTLDAYGIWHPGGAS